MKRIIHLPREIDSRYETKVRVLYGRSSPATDYVEIDLVFPNKHMGENGSIPRTPKEFAELAWSCLQTGNPSIQYEGGLNNYLGVRSCDVGDVIEIYFDMGCQRFAVAPVGMKQITVEQADELLALPYRDRLFWFNDVTE